MPHLDERLAIVAAGIGHFGGALGRCHHAMVRSSSTSTRKGRTALGASLAAVDITDAAAANVFTHFAAHRLFDNVHDLEILLLCLFLRHRKRIARPTKLAGERLAQRLRVALLSCGGRIGAVLELTARRQDGRRPKSAPWTAIPTTPTCST